MIEYATRGDAQSAASALTPGYEIHIKQQGKRIHQTISIGPESRVERSSNAFIRYISGISLSREMLSAPIPNLDLLLDVLKSPFGIDHSGVTDDAGLLPHAARHSTSRVFYSVRPQLLNGWLGRMAGCREGAAEGVGGAGCSLGIYFLVVAKVQPAIPQLL